MVLQPLDVPFHPRPQISSAVVPIRRNHVRQQFEPDKIAPAAAVQAEAQHDRNLQERSKPKRPFGKPGRRPKEIACDGLFVFQQPIAQDAD